ncbi:MAG TPA: hypothetical protein VFE33_33340 [Thermoanaerobaculia bacterium]|nr:hypothetical protein [Thermoanaerobaculia bacterium]
MKKVLTVLFLASFAAGLLAQRPPEPKPASASHVVAMPARGVEPGVEALLPKLGITCHGGSVIAHPKVVEIFWGPNFANPASPDFTYAQNLIAYRNQLGSTHVWSLLTQYGVLPSNLGAGTPDWFDTSTPPTNVTDSAVRSKVTAYLATHAFDANTIYEVFLPSTSYSSSGGSTSCGGPALAYCTYNATFLSGTSTVKYTVQPYASCAGCQVTGWTAAQNQEHLVEHSTVDAVTSGCFDPTGLGVADKCAWSPAPFLLGGYGYQYIWSNAANACAR